MSIVLDTTYILPLFNIDVDVFGKKDLGLLLKSKVRKLVPPHILIEAKWVLYSLLRRNIIRDFDRAISDFNDGLHIIKHSDTLRLTEYPDLEVDLIESKIYKTVGIGDYFDRVILATSKVYNAILLTEDEELLSLNTENYSELLPRTIINWNTFKKKVKF